MNKEITIIDLLDMNAKGEKMQNKIKFEDNTYKLTDYGYEAENGDELYGLINFDGSNLNETVEIIEDNDKLEDMFKFKIGGLYFTTQQASQLIDNLTKMEKRLIDHINKIEEKLDER